MLFSPYLQDINIHMVKHYVKQVSQGAGLARSHYRAQEFINPTDNGYIADRQDGSEDQTAYFENNAQKNQSDYANSQCTQCFDPKAVDRKKYEHHAHQ